MKTKAFIRIIATAFTAVTIIGAVSACSKKDDKDTSRVMHITAEETTTRSGRPETKTESTAVPSESKPVTGDSIILCLNGMTTDEIVEDLWKATHVEEGMYSEDFYEKVFTEGCKLFENRKKDDDFSWFFYEGSSDTIRYISRISVFSGMKCDPVFDGSGRVVLELHIEDKDYAFEVAEAIVERIQSEGYEIGVNRKSGENEDTWYVGFQKDRTTCTLQVNKVADYVINFDFPIDAKGQFTDEAAWSS